MYSHPCVPSLELRYSDSARELHFSVGGVLHDATVLCDYVYWIILRCCDPNAVKHDQPLNPSCCCLDSQMVLPASMIASAARCTNAHLQLSEFPKQCLQS